MRSIFALLFMSCCLSLMGPNVANGADITVAGRPTGLAVDEKGGRLFVLNQSASTLTVINEKDLNIIENIPLKKDIKPNIDSRSVVYDAGSDRIYLTTGREVLVIDGKTYEIVLEIKGQGERNFSPDIAVEGEYLYTVDWEKYLHVYKKTGEFQKSINLPKDSGVVFMHLGENGRVYVSSRHKGLMILDGRAGKIVATIPFEAFSIPVSNENKVYVAGVGKVYFIDTTRLKIEKTIDVEYPNISGLGTALNYAKGHLFVVTAEDTITVIDTVKGKKLEKIKVCSDPKSIAVNKETSTVYVACPGSDKITVLNY